MDDFPFLFLILDCLCLQVGIPDFLVYLPGFLLFLSTWITNTETTRERTTRKQVFTQSMGLFYRSSRSNSSSSTDITSSTSESYTPRTSIDSTISTPSLPIIKTLTTPPLLTLPLELIQHISSYLNPASTASFSLTSRYT
jgi:hypothetical protein